MELLNSVRTLTSDAWSDLSASAARGTFAWHTIHVLGNKSQLMLDGVTSWETGRWGDYFDIYQWLPVLGMSPALLLLSASKQRSRDLSVLSENNITLASCLRWATLNQFLKRVAGQDTERAFVMFLPIDLSGTGIQLSNT